MGQRLRPARGKGGDWLIRSARCGARPRRRIRPPGGYLRAHHRNTETWLSPGQARRRPTPHRRTDCPPRLIYHTRTGRRPGTDRRTGFTETGCARFLDDARQRLNGPLVLTALVKTRLRRMQYRPGLLDGFLARTGLDLTPFGDPRK